MIGDEHEERSEVKYFDCIIMGKEIKRKTYLLLEFQKVNR